MPRPDKTELPATLGEVLGKKAQISGLKDLPDILGEKMPEMEFNEVGRLRLLKSLKGRFGEGFRNLPGITGVIKEFDTEMRFRSAIRKNKR